MFPDFTGASRFSARLRGGLVFCDGGALWPQVPGMLKGFEYERRRTFTYIYMWASACGYALDRSGSTCEHHRISALPCKANINGGRQNVLTKTCRRVSADEPAGKHPGAEPTLALILRVTIERPQPPPYTRHICCFLRRDSIIRGDLVRAMFRAISFSRWGLCEEALNRWQRALQHFQSCLLYTSPSPRDQRGSRMPSSA